MCVCANHTKGFVKIFEDTSKLERQKHKTCNYLHTLILKMFKYPFLVHKTSRKRMVGCAESLNRLLSSFSQKSIYLTNCFSRSLLILRFSVLAAT